MINNTTHANELASPIQDIKARVEIYKGSTLVKTCDCGSVLNEFTVDRAGAGKFFGYGICQKLKTVFFDEETALSITKENSLKPAFGVSSNYLYPFPTFYAEEVSREEETGDITVTSYDCLYKAANHTVSELNLPSSYTLLYFASACAALLGVSLAFENIPDIAAFQVNYPAGANFEGTETVRRALDAVAEATQTIYYINSNEALTFKRLDKSGDPVHTIDRSNYMTLSSEGPRVLSKIMHVTELGDNVEPSSDIEGVTQYIRDNPFWELREDIGTLVDNAQAIAGGISIEQCECNWFGNYLLEIGDKIDIIAKGNKTMTTYLLDDSLTYDGSIEQITKWQYDENDAETAGNPTSIGDALNQTFARVDKVNKEITLQVADLSNTVGGFNNRITDNTAKITTLTINSANITAKVNTLNTQVETVSDTVDGFDSRITTNTEKIGQLEVTDESITASVSSLENTVETVENTVSGFDSRITDNTAKITTLTINNSNITAKVSSLNTKVEEVESAVGEVESTVDGFDSRITTNTENISSLQITSTGIETSVKSLETTTTENFESLETQYEALTQEVNTKVSAEDVQMTISTELVNGVDKVTTSTGFTFNKDGLTVSKSDSEMSTQITEDGMTIDKNGTEVLRADNQGVIAQDLHAVTYLWIGDNSRFEDQGSRTACFWMGD